MTGAGTQADPYIPETLTELVSVASKNFVYIRLDTDIVAEDDPAYTGKIGTFTIGNMTRLYSDVGAAIKGVTVNAASMISSRAASVLGIWFRDWTWENANGSMLSGTGTASKMFENCNFSAKIVTSSSQVSVPLSGSQRFGCYNCSFDIEWEQTERQSTPLAQSPSALVWNCTIVHRGLKADKCVLTCGGRQNAFIFYGLVAINFVEIFNATLSDYLSYVAIIDPAFADGCTVKGGYSDIPCNVYAHDDPDADFTGTVGADFHECALSKMKDKDWLVSIGFIADLSDTVWKWDDAVLNGLPYTVWRASSPGSGGIYVDLPSGELNVKAFAKAIIGKNTVTFSVSGRIGTTFETK